MKPLKYICVMSCRCCFPQDMVHTCVIQHVGLHTLRNSKTKEFFNLDCGGPDCAQALEQNFTFVLELCATLSGADPWPRHKQFKAGLVHSVWQSVKSYIYIFVNMVCFAHRQFGTTLPLATVSSQKGQRSGQSRRAIYITCSSLKWDLVHIGFTSRLTGVGVHPGWLCQWFGPGCADFVFACRIVKVLSLSLWWLPRSQAVSTFKICGVGKSASSSSVCRKLFKQANLVTSLC